MDSSSIFYHENLNVAFISKYLGTFLCLLDAIVLKWAGIKITLEEGEKMLYSRILVLYDNSALSIKALEKAVEIAKLDKNTVLDVLHVVTVPTNEFIVGDFYKEVYESTYKSGKEVISKAEALLKDLPNRTHAYVKEGQPVRTILEQLKENDYDLVVIGSRGLSGFKEFLGSVSHGIVQHSPVPVLVVK